MKEKLTTQVLNFYSTDGSSLGILQKHALSRKIVQLSSHTSIQISWLKTCLFRPFAQRGACWRLSSHSAALSLLWQALTGIEPLDSATNSPCFSRLLISSRFSGPCSIRIKGIFWLLLLSCDYYFFYGSCFTDHQTARSLFLQVGDQAWHLHSVFILIQQSAKPHLFMVHICMQ